MAHTDLFKPFIDTRLGQLCFKKDMTEGFLIEVAQRECSSIFPGLQKDFPDVLLSLRCGKARKPTAPSIASNDTKRTKTSSKLRQRPDNDDNISYFTEDSAEAAANYPRPNFISLNPVLETLPALDDVSAIPDLQSLIQNATDFAIVHQLAAQLFATLFYAESDAPMQDTAAGEILIPRKPSPYPLPSFLPYPLSTTQYTNSSNHTPVRIHCRLLDHTPQLRALGTLLKPSGPFRNSEFIFWEQDYGEQIFPLAASTLDTMTREALFPVLRILLPVWDVDALVHGVLRLENGEEYALSAFPRRLRAAGVGLHS
jgi:hypothetical protein